MKATHRRWISGVLGTILSGMVFIQCGLFSAGPRQGMPFGFGGFLIRILFLALIVVVIYRVLKGARSRGPDGIQETPMDILKKRYARGELTTEEFERMKRELEG